MSHSAVREGCTGQQSEQGECSLKSDKCLFVGSGDPTRIITSL